MTTWETFRLLCRCLGGGDDAALEAACSVDALPQLTELAGSRDLLPALAVRLGSRLSSGDPASVTALQSALQDNTRRQLHLQAQALKAARAMNAAGVEPVLLKGTALMFVQPAPPPGLRKQVDIDLLLEPAALWPSAQALLAQGYQFCDYHRKTPELFTDLDRARQLSAHHHHLPPMLRAGQHATLELHSHPLPRRYQRQLPLAAFLENTQRLEQHGAAFHLPAAARQRQALVYAAYLHDGYAARRDFPIRAGMDYKALLEAEQAGGGITNFSVDKTLCQFEQLVDELLGLGPALRSCPSSDAGPDLAALRRRLASPSLARALDMQARWRHLGAALLFNAGKLPRYLRGQLR
ncbi:hypothetical protein E4634_12620 [Mangrovimicrobium sediminis]|uniref:Nucleotidyltransferase family protein n=1 Tax=Mangrovimicrobium sediminis TaxID=2562682 RepID=A0A4Z0M173_9GAMM|nr:nucleotidyltransferase family protein [Haliea sp. SAOS-164]TGD73118.1 hypothetical protein E4634_12620 [Haliea sp. SAOS-164]